jgi:biopolymer transport protein ExbD
VLLKQSTDDLPTINLTPMLDVVFNLIVFFMVGTKFVEMDRSIQVDVPKVSDAGPLTSAPVRRVVTVTREGETALDGRTMSLGEVTSELAAARKEYPELAVLVKGDGEGRFQSVADALSACTRAGIADTSICVQLGDGGTKRR